MDALAAGHITEREIDAAAAMLEAISPQLPATAVILGSGLGGLAATLEGAQTVSYSALPGFPTATAVGHSGCLVCGRLAGISLLLLAGRTHVYEGTPASRITLPLRVLQRLGVQNLIVTNAAGGLHPDLAVGDVVILRDYLNLMFVNPLVGLSEECWGPRFLDQCGPFDAEMSQWALEAARAQRVPAQYGVYAAVTGPNYETRAEQRMYRRLGADVIGMSTVPEVLTAAQLGLRVLGLSTVTNCCRPDAPEPTTGAAVVHAAGAAAERTLAIIRDVIHRLARA